MTMKMNIRMNMTMMMMIIIIIIIDVQVGFFCKGSVTGLLAYFWPYCKYAPFVCTAACQKLATWNFPLLPPQEYAWSQTLVTGCIAMCACKNTYKKNAKNIHKLHKTALKIFLLLSASFPSPDSSFEEDRPQSVSSSLENSFNLIFPAADHYWESNTRWLRLLRWILPGGLSFQTFVRNLKF